MHYTGALSMTPVEQMTHERFSPEYLQGITIHWSGWVGSNPSAQQILVRVTTRTIV